jgi:hypothetical protein
MRLFQKKVESKLTSGCMIYSIGELKYMQVDWQTDRLIEGLMLTLISELEAISSIVIGPGSYFQ